MKAARFALWPLLTLAAPSLLLAGAYVSASNSNPDRIVHPIGYLGSGGILEVSVCLEPESADAGNVDDIQDLVIPLLNAMETWNRLEPVLPNVILGGDNDIPSGLDWETTIVHEIGHCIGLSHPNAASESGLPGSDTNYTKAGAGANGSLDIATGADGIRGSSDDIRGDDVNLHWFEIGVNNPFLLPATVDGTTYSRDLGDLPGGHTFAANGDIDVGDDLGFTSSEAVMQQGARGDEDQRQLAPDDAATILFAATGLDELAGTADDYDLQLRYVGITDDCDIRVRVGGGGFASCSFGTTAIDGEHRRLTSARVSTSTTSNWYFNQVARLALADLSVTKEASQPIVDAGATFDYTITVTNDGPDDAENVGVTDILPAQLTLVSTTGCGEDPNGTPSCSLGTVPASTSSQITVRVTVDADFTGPLSNTATVTSSTADVTLDDTTASVDVEVVESGSSIFADGFESGSTTAWSSSSP